MSNEALSEFVGSRQKSSRIHPNSALTRGPDIAQKQREKLLKGAALSLTRTGELYRAQVNSFMDGLRPWVTSDALPFSPSEKADRRIVKKELYTMSYKLDKIGREFVGFAMESASQTSRILENFLGTAQEESILTEAKGVPQWYAHLSAFDEWVAQYVASQFPFNLAKHIKNGLKVKGSLGGIRGGQGFEVNFSNGTRVTFGVTCIGDDKMKYRITWTGDGRDINKPIETIVDTDESEKISAAFLKFLTDEISPQFP